ncbi:Peptidoglycan/LPS O-acetylase OafA/YrhL, contains acyltransferase and SGNH-hydrolase domains [Melghirimyces thermohalophilus]|uniref:Peptidoglycan/LPS O-acetylase OafA/YrhL, contains acyltransferase and SGNH-hydrolase domains n=1 Tax=Melghirimyces thermohalophilus TaxID=1236220 RepID=A0A1G6NBY9_9BACL|nr:acyltransferase family protein [Melghirimyces thermohalophilus]SDC65322.1 Peptidoglycan/LPS O-acetylase OafA/YrhL, contains acyltransferase and SGNH-hydrolase domains [Melghirimyces thermohalophilus]
MSSVKTNFVGSSTPQKEGRLFYIDNLRAALTMLVVLHHLVYFSILNEVLTPGSFEFGVGLLFLAFNQSFFMGAFFLISGYFVPSSFERNGAARFMKDRFIRFFVPFIFYVLVLSQVQSIEAYMLNHEPFTWHTYISHLTYGPMWYVELLLVFICLYAVWVKFMRKNRLSEVRKSIPPTYTMLTIFVMMLAAAYFIIRLWIPALGLPGGSPEVKSVVGLFTASGYELPQYIGLFIIGIVAYQHNWFRTIPDSMGKAGFGIAIGASLLLLPFVIIFGLDGLRFSGGWNWTSLLYSLWESLFCVGIILGLIIFFRKRIFRQGRGWYFLSTHSYVIYIIHIPIIAIVIAALKVIHVPTSFMFPATVLITIPLCFSLGYLLRRIPFISKIL